MKERKYEVEGIGIVDEEFLKQEYQRELDEVYEADDYIPSYEEWKEDLLLDPRSALSEITDKQ